MVDLHTLLRSQTLRRRNKGCTRLVSRRSICYLKPICPARVPSPVSQAVCGPETPGWSGLLLTLSHRPPLVHKLEAFQLASAHTHLIYAHPIPADLSSLLRPGGSWSTTIPFPPFCPHSCSHTQLLVHLQVFFVHPLTPRSLSSLRCLA